MYQDLKKFDTFNVGSTKSHKSTKGITGQGKIGHPGRFADKNKNKRDEAAEFFVQEKLLIEYWVSLWVS